MGEEVWVRLGMEARCVRVCVMEWGVLFPLLAADR